MEEQKERQQEEQQPEQVEETYCCPCCGQPMWARRGPWAMKHMGPWGMKRMGPWGRGMGPWRMGPGGMGYGGPWAAYGPHPGHWLHQPRAMVWAGVVPAMLGFALGYLIAGARMAAVYAYACEEKRKR